MKSTKAMEIEGVGCVVQVSTQQKNQTGMFTFKKTDNGEILTIDSVCQYDMSQESASYSVAEAVTFVPGVKIFESFDNEGNVTSRRLVSI